MGQKTQMNFSRGVDFKATPEDASKAAAAKGEATKQQVNFKCDVEPAKGYTPKQGPQINFKY